MTASQSSIRLSPRRFDQLKAIGTALNLSIADAIALMIRDRIAAGTIPDTIPGVQIERVANGVKVAIDDGQAKTFSKEGARRLATTIREVVDDGQAATVNVDHGFAVFRRGTGYKIIVPFPGLDNSFSADLARDFARLVENAAE